MQDQAAIWEARYVAGREADGSVEPTAFCLALAALLTERSHLLEIGCALGHDAAYLASLGHHVLATDVSETAVRSARQRYGTRAGPRFKQVDASLPLKMRAGSLDAVYARLSLHYFTDEVTRRIVAEVARVLKPNGVFAFMCKSDHDPLYGKGIEIEPDVFDSNHLRHFFSEAYSRDLLGPAFHVVSVESKQGPLYGSSSAWVEAIARRRA